MNRASLAVTRAAGLEGRGRTRLTASDDRIVLTGAGGWLGLATLELLGDTLGPDNVARRVKCYGSSSRTLRLRNGLVVMQAALTALDELPRAPTLLLHAAFLTKDKAEAMDEAAYVAANRAIRDTVLAALDTIGVHALFVSSSGAARHADDPAASPAMRSYGTLKRDDERAFAAWADDGARTAVIARVFNLSGPYINKPEHYALAGFILDALAGRALAVRAPRPVLRSYVAVAELMSVVFGLLTDRPAGTIRFDTRGDEILEMEEVARAVTAVLGPVPVTRAPLGDAAADDYVGDGAAYAAYRAAQNVRSRSFAEQIGETATFLQQMDEWAGCECGLTW